MKPRPRNFKRLCVSPETVLGLFLEPKHDVLCRLRFEGISDDAEILEVDYSVGCRNFGFLVVHPTFPEVPEGECIPCELAQGILYHRIEGYEEVKEPFVFKLPEEVSDRVSAMLNGGVTVRADEPVVVEKW